MMRKLVCMFALVLVCSPSIAFAVASAGIPEILENGFKKYATEGPKAAIESWSKGSAIEGSKEALSQANNFRQIQDFYGQYIGYEFIKTHPVSVSTSTVLLNIKYEKGNLYSVFYLYKKPNGQEVITSFDFHTKAKAIWPTSAVFGCGEE